MSAEWDQVAALAQHARDAQQAIGAMHRHLVDLAGGEAQLLALIERRDNEQADLRRRTHIHAIQEKLS